MKTSQLFSLISTALMVVVVIYAGAHFRGQIEAATNPVMDAIRSSSSAEMALAKVAGVGLVSALAGYILCRFGRRVNDTYGDKATDVLTSLIAGVLVILIMFGAVPGGLSAIWLVAMFAGAGIAAWRS